MHYTDVKKRTEIERTRLLYRFALKAAPFNIFIAMIATAFLFGKVDEAKLIFFFLSITAIALIRMYVVIYTNKHANWQKEASRYELFFAIGSLLQSLLWAGWYLYFADHLTTSGQYFLILLLSGLVAGSVTTLSSSRTVFLCFMVPMLLIPAMWYCYQFSTASLPVAAVIILYAIGISFGHVRTREFILQVIHLSNEKQRLIEKLQEISLTDELTQIANRRHFITTLDKEWRRNLRTQTALALLIIDIDYFKMLNDTLGHQAGDKCLQEVAQIIAANLKRSGDLAARYGGEEFACILPNTDLAGAKVVANFIQQSLRENPLIHPQSPLGENLTVSIGVASIVPSKDSSFEQLIAQADAQLYKAKTQGRNQIA